MSKNEDTLVLVADDEPSMLALLSAYIRSKGYRVLEASDGDMAWQLAREHLPHAVVLDVMMPGMSGWEVCKKIRESVSLAHTGVVMLTGIGESLNELTSPLYGADAYIDKPFEFAELEARIKETLERRRDGALGRPDGGSDEEADEDEDEDELSGGEDEEEDEESSGDDDEESDEDESDEEEEEDEDEGEEPAPRGKKSAFEEDEPVTQRFAKASAQKKAKKKAASRATDEDEMEVDELIEEAQAEVQAKKKVGKKKAKKKAGKKAAGKKKASKKAGKKAAGKKKAKKKGRR